MHDHKTEGRKAAWPQGRMAAWPQGRMAARPARNVSADLHRTHPFFKPIEPIEPIEPIVKPLSHPTCLRIFETSNRLERVRRASLLRYIIHQIQDSLMTYAYFWGKTEYIMPGHCHNHVCSLAMLAVWRCLQISHARRLAMHAD
jgi:hypothetical protein